MKNNRIFWMVPMVAAFLFAACSGEPEKEKKTESPATTTRVEVPRFDRDSAFHFIEKQVSFGPRVPNTSGHQQTKEWLVSKLQSYGAEIIQQDFQAKAYTGITLNGTNIIAQYNPDHTKRIILAAHWDTRHIADSDLSTTDRDKPIMGADDGGSGVAVLVEIARQLHQHPIDLGIDIILFDAEDHGLHAAGTLSMDEEMKNMETWCLGSQYWSNNLHVAGYKARYGILLDMVGAKNARFPKEGFSMQVAPKLVNDIWSLAQRMGYTNYFVNATSGGITDDHYFVAKNAGIPMINIINISQKKGQTFGDHWHTQADNLDVIDSRTLRAVGQVVLAVIYREAAGTF